MGMEIMDVTCRVEVTVQCMICYVPFFSLGNCISTEMQCRILNKDDAQQSKIEQACYSSNSLNLGLLIVKYNLDSLMDINIYQNQVVLKISGFTIQWLL